MIELSDKDADSILCYLRHNLEEEHRQTVDKLVSFIEIMTAGSK